MFVRVQLQSLWFRRGTEAGSEESSSRYNGAKIIINSVSVSVTFTQYKTDLNISWNRSKVTYGYFTATEYTYFGFIVKRSTAARSPQYTKAWALCLFIWCSQRSKASPNKHARNGHNFWPRHILLLLCLAGRRTDRKDHLALVAARCATMDFSQAGHRAQGRKWLSITGRANSNAAPSPAAPSILPKSGGQLHPCPPSFTPLE